MYYRPDLYNKTAEERAQALKAIPEGVTSVDLSNNGFDCYLNRIVKGLPKNVTSLDLSRNYLGGKSVKELAQIFKAIPESVTSLDLSWNGLGKKRAKELIQIIEAIGKNLTSLTSLNLNGNSLGDTSVEELEQIIEAIGKNLTSLTSLNLSANYLDNKSDKELKQIFARLPKNVIFLDLSLNGLPAEKIWDLLPDHIMTVKIDSDTILNKSNSNIIEGKVKALLAADYIPCECPFELIELPFQITETLGKLWEKDENINSKDLTENKQLLAALILNHPEKNEFFAGKPYTVTLPDSTQKKITLSENIFCRTSNNDERHYQVYSENKEQGSRSLALVAHYRFKLKNNDIHILGKSSGKRQKFHKIAKADVLAGTGLVKEATVLNTLYKNETALGFKQKPLHTGKYTFFDNNQEKYNYDIVTQDFITGTDGIDFCKNNPIKEKSAAELAKWLLQLLNQLKRIHDGGYIHSDIKPDNLMFSDEGDVYLVDYGLAFPREQKNDDVQGSPCYFPPEVAKILQNTQAGDIYQLALSFLVLLDEGEIIDDRMDEYEQVEKLMEKYFSTNWNKYSSYEHDQFLSKLLKKRQKYFDDIYDGFTNLCFDEVNEFKENASDNPETLELIDLLLEMIDEVAIRPNIDTCLDKLNKIITQYHLDLNIISDKDSSHSSVCANNNSKP